ncbi:hypothetical protein GQ43DRAFT_475665 [Delitschia confertaspora ATCC 74209]|uniref:Uncharacterized protein n=1 Tax=Delitschia confertaspora ATCC 74209 TaxID=1513339 RepID=A0A9P4JHC0_9PLEO|nr:hypothetical protein GQ43DRAFT_475665 [Delitschia confertaspora ATCC 74209]
MNTNGPLRDLILPDLVDKSTEEHNYKFTSVCPTATEPVYLDTGMDGNGQIIFLHTNRNIAHVRILEERREDGLHRMIYLCCWTHNWGSSPRQPLIFVLTLTNYISFRNASMVQPPVPTIQVPRFYNGMRSISPLVAKYFDTISNLWLSYELDNFLVKRKAFGHRAGLI